MRYFCFFQLEIPLWCGQVNDWWDKSIHRSSGAAICTADSTGEGRNEMDACRGVGLNALGCVYLEIVGCVVRKI